MIRPLVHLLAGSLLAWLLLAIPAWLLAGDAALLDMAVACGLCLAPMVATMVWCHFAFGGTSEQQLAAVLGGTGLRLLVAVGGGVGLSRSVPALDHPAFLIWVVVFYLITLALEITLVVRRQNALADALATPVEQPRS